MDHEGPCGSAARARRVARGGRRLTGTTGFRLLQDSLGLAGPAAPGEIKARYRALAQRCAAGEARAEEHQRLESASLALAQELVHLGHDEARIERMLIAEGCPVNVAAGVARASAGPISRVVHDPLERATIAPEDAAYARLSERLVTAEAIRTATASSYGFGFMARLAIAFIVVVGGLIAALDFFPRVLAPPKAAPPAPAPYPVELLPPSPPGKSEGR